MLDGGLGLFWYADGDEQGRERMAEPSIKERVLAMVALLNRGAVDDLCQGAAPGLIIEDGHSGLPSGREGLRLRLRSWEDAIPDLALTVQSVSVDADEAMMTFFWSGTQHGELFGVPATGGRVAFRALVRTRWAEGLLTELDCAWHAEEPS
jgi:predicted ester cyclase